MQIDADGWAYDADGVPAHQSAPPMLVNIDSHPYPPDVQRNVPGRDFVDLTRIEPPWSERRHLVPPLSKGELAVRRAIRDLRSARELVDYEASIPVSPEELERRQQAAQEARRFDRELRLQQQRSRRRQHRSEMQAQLNQLINVRKVAAASVQPRSHFQEPRYVLDETWTDTEDADYSAGEASDANAESSRDGVSTPEQPSDAATSDDDIGDGYDSDYELGRRETETVHRTRSAVTVTGRRKRPRAVVMPEASPSPQPTSYRRSTRVKRATTRFSSTSPQRRRMSKRKRRHVMYGETSDC